MIRRLLAATLAFAACGRSQGVADQDLGGLVVAAKAKPEPIDVARAAKEPAELGRTLGLPHHAIIGALGPHTIAISSETTVDEGGKQVSQLADKTTIELGDAGAFHAVYTNSADYGRDVVFAGGQLYLRPRYQRWHQRAPEAPDEPERLRDQFYEAIGATWDLLEPGVELTDLGPTQIAGRSGRKIAIKLAPTPRTPAAEPLVQRKWREKRVIEAVSGEVVLDVDKGVPLAVKLAGTVGFSREGRRFAMKLAVQAEVSGIGQVVTMTVPAGDDVVATPERLREVDDRDFLLQGIAPPLRKNADGTAVAPQPAVKPAAPPSPPGKPAVSPSSPGKPPASADPGSNSRSKR